MGGADAYLEKNEGCGCCARRSFEQNKLRVRVRVLYFKSYGPFPRPSGA